jgi:deoxyribodipyrimidine photo-lyase
MTALVWFRRDLRVHDHPPLHEALAAHDRVVPVFVLDERLLRTSPSRTSFMLDCLRELRAALRERGGELFVRAGEPHEVLPELARETGASAVYWAPDVSPYSRARDERVVAALRERDVAVCRTPGNYIAGVERPYVVFTPFSRAWERVARRPVHGAPRELHVPSGLTAGRIPTVASELPEPFPAGEAEARRRMNAFLRDDAAAYEERHDRVAGGTSALSPYLHFGCLSPRELEDRAADVPELRRQLAWRDFFAHVLLHNPGNAKHAHQRQLDGIEWSGGEEELAAWKEGRTGFPIVDAGMRQLARTGWMHNRARLIVACFLVKDLHVDWREGERHFMRLLLDGDAAVNNGNWQWVSSVGVDPAPLSRRLYNPALQQKRHDPDGTYVRRWVPELADVPTERLTEPHGLAPGYPPPIVDHAEERRRTLDAYRAARV